MENLGSSTPDTARYFMMMVLRACRSADEKRCLKNLIDQPVGAHPGQTPDQALDLRRVADLRIESGVAGQTLGMLQNPFEFGHVLGNQQPLRVMNQ